MSPRNCDVSLHRSPVRARIVVTYRFCTNIDLWYAEPASCSRIDTRPTSICSDCEVRRNLGRGRVEASMGDMCLRTSEGKSVGRFESFQPAGSLVLASRGDNRTSLDETHQTACSHSPTDISNQNGRAHTLIQHHFALIIFPFSRDIFITTSAPIHHPLDTIAIIE